MFLFHFIVTSLIVHQCNILPLIGFFSLHPESGIILFVVRKTHKCVFIMFLGSPTLGSVVNLMMNVHGN